MHRIYFDENEGDGYGRYDLGIPGALEDIKPIESNLTDGMHVILYDAESFEVEAVLEFDKKYNVWMAKPIWSTKRLEPSA